MVRMKIVLASGSPRRKKLLASLVRPFGIAPAPEPKIHPSMWKQQTSAEIVERLARFKAMWAALRAPGALVVGADTLVCAGKHQLGKPAIKEEARKMLQLLSGRKIEALTGVCMVVPKKDGKLKIISWHEKATVRFRPLEKAEIARYLCTGKWVGKAGAFNILEKPAKGWAEEIRGDAHTVAGLPLGRLKKQLAFYSKRGQ